MWSAAALSSSAHASATGVLAQQLHGCAQSLGSTPGHVVEAAPLLSLCRRSTPARADQSEAALSLLFPAFQAWLRALVPLAHHQATRVSAEQAESRWSSLRHWSAFEHDAAGGARTLNWSSCCTTACREVASADIRRFWPLEAPQERVRCFRSRTERKRVAFVVVPPGLPLGDLAKTSGRVKVRVCPRGPRPGQTSAA